MLTLPLYYEDEHLRVVHACWDADVIGRLRGRLVDDRLTPELLVASADKSTQLYADVEIALKGREMALPPGASFVDGGGHARGDADSLVGRPGGPHLPLAQPRAAGGTPRHPGRPRARGCGARLRRGRAAGLLRALLAARRAGAAGAERVLPRLQRGAGRGVGGVSVWGRGGGGEWTVGVGRLTRFPLSCGDEVTRCRVLDGG